MTDTEKTEPAEPTDRWVYKLGHVVGWAGSKVIRLIIGFIVSVALVTLGLAVAAAFIILFSVIIAVIALFCALIVLVLPFTTFCGYTQPGTLKSVMDELSKKTKAAAEGAASNVHTLDPTKRK